MFSVLGWKDVLRPIRDGYRHLFPSPDTGPTPVERERQRALDGLIGLTYFDTFEQLEAWEPADADPIAVGNTPLLQRPDCGNVGEENTKAKILLCHDYAGNYHEYEGAQNAGVESEMYTCTYLQFVDVFVYFSHKLACVPPASWINTCHRNGVKILGTLLVEPQTEGIERLFETSDVQGAESLTFAQKLARMAETYGFDGWLVNLETTFPRQSWSAQRLETFLRQLRGDLGADKQLIWYDALTGGNKVSYQNGLTTLNLPFAQACGRILTNYAWHLSNADSSKELAIQQHFPVEDIFFGIDVWAQNATKFAHPRVTYPERGGGGTNTGIAVAELAKMGFSAGVFAPAWSYEHFPGRGRAVERTVWEGLTLPDQIECSCGDISTRHVANPLLYMTKSAEQYPVGSDVFFYADFGRPFQNHGEKERDLLYGGRALHSQLGAQSVLPQALTQRLQGSHRLSYRLHDHSDGTMLVIEMRQAGSNEDTQSGAHKQMLPLYQLRMIADGSLHLRMSCRLLAPTIGLGLLLQGGEHSQLIPIRNTRETQLIEAPVCIVSDISMTPYLHTIGIVADESPNKEWTTADVLQIFELGVSTCSSRDPSASCAIDNIRIEPRRAAGTVQSRLCWSNVLPTGVQPRQNALPYSQTTGPISHFEVSMDGVRLQRCYATECVLSGYHMDQLRGRNVHVEITAVGFDGQILARKGQPMQL